MMSHPPPSVTLYELREWHAVPLGMDHPQAHSLTQTQGHFLPCYGKEGRALFLPTAIAGPNAQQASLQSISGAISQLHCMVSSLSAAVSDVKTRVTALELCPPKTLPDPVAVPVLTSSPAGTPESTPTVLPAHLVSAGLRKHILESKDVNLASLLISVHDLADNRS